MWIRAGWVLRSVLEHHAGGQRQTENKGNRGLQCSLSISLPPPLSTCLCTGLLLISEALSFVFVRCPKECGMKRDTWRGAGWLWLWRVTTHTHTRKLQNVTAESCRQFLPVNHCHQPLVVNAVSFTHHCLFRNMDKVKQRNMVTWMKFNWNCTELGEELGDQQTNYQQRGSR